MNPSTGRFRGFRRFRRFRGSGGMTGAGFAPATSRVWAWRAVCCSTPPGMPAGEEVPARRARIKDDRKCRGRCPRIAGPVEAFSATADWLGVLASTSGFPLTSAPADVRSISMLIAPLPGTDGEGRQAAVGSAGDAAD